MSEDPNPHAVAMGRILNWLAALGGVVAGGLLLWIGSQTYELAKNQAVTAERVQTVQRQQQDNTTALLETSRVVRDVSSRVQRVEDNIESERERAREAREHK